MGFILRPPLTNNIIFDTVFNFSDPWVLLSKGMMPNSQGHYEDHLPYLEKLNNYFFYFYFLHLYWSIIALQWCVSFCFITK